MEGKVRLLLMCSGYWPTGQAQMGALGWEVGHSSCCARLSLGHQLSGLIRQERQKLAVNGE